MITLKDYVNWGLTHCDKTASAEGVPLILEKCVKNKKMKQLEVYGNSVQNGTPSPEAPVEVESVGEKCTKNLYDAESYPMTKAYYIHGSEGGFFGNASYAATEDFIPCIELRGKTITINHTGGSNPGIAYYDENKEFISGTRNASSNNVKITSVVPENASFYRFCVKAEYANVAQVEFGSTATEYEPYGKYKIPVTVRGKNLFKPTGVSGDGIGGDGKLKLKGSYGTTIDSTDFSDNKVSVTQVPNESYVTEAYQNGYMCFLIPELTIGKNYALSFDVKITDNPLNATRFVVYACTYPINSAFLNLTRCKIPFTYRTPNGGKPPYVEIRCGGASFELSNVMITEEGQDDTFEPYVEPQTTNVYLNEPLRKIGDYADVLDFKAKKVIRIDSVEDVECELPTLSAKTSVIEINTSILPSNIKGKYIKR